MKQVRVQTDALLEILRVNQAAHLVQFTVLQDEFMAAGKRLLTSALETLTADKRLHVVLQAPQSSYDEYSTAIGMLEMHTEPTIELEQHEFEQYVLDKWTWKREYAMLSSSYTAPNG